MTLIRFHTKGPKFIIGWITVFLIRLIPFRPPNFEPMLATIMPFSKKFTLLEIFLFGFLGILGFDAITSGIGIWTLVTAITYGLLGMASNIYFRHKEASIKHFLFFGTLGTIAYDAITGLTLGPLLFHQSFMTALVGQIPFTLMHLLGTVVFSVVLSPALYHWIIRNEKIEISVARLKVFLTH